MKTCTKCKELKSLDLFNKRSAAKDGLTSRCGECIRRQQRERWNSWDKRQQRDHNLKARYGPEHGIDWYEATLEKQENLCAICGLEPRGRGSSPDSVLNVDHEDGTYITRGLLCTNCNLAIGHLRHDIQLLQAAISYLEEYQNVN